MNTTGEEDHYYRLDNSAVFMAAIAGASGPFVYRFYCILKTPVILESLQAALNSVYARFPFFFVTLRQGIFWHYLDPVSIPPVVEQELPYPCAKISHSFRRPLIRVIAYGRRISCEINHVVTDGTGASVFLRALVAEYLRNAGIVSDRAEILPFYQLDEKSGKEEEEDSYAKYFKAASTQPAPRPRAFLLPGARMLLAYRETVGSLDTKIVRGIVKGFGVSITDFLAALYMDTLQSIHEALPSSKRRRARMIITIQVPVNLRNIYPSKTLRNFFLYADPSIDLRLGHWTFEEILHRVHHQMRLGLEKKELLRQLKRNVGGERNPVGRPIPLPFKTLVLRIVNLVIGVGSYSGSLSNMGVLDFADPYGEAIERFGFIPSRARATGANIGVMTYRDRLYIHVASQIREREFERVFFSKLATFGANPLVVTNMPYHEGGE